MKVKEAKARIAEMERTCENLQKIMSVFSDVDKKKRKHQFS